MTYMQILPWGCFRFMSNESSDDADDSDNIYFRFARTSMGRNPICNHIIFKELYISGIHCIVTLQSGTSFDTAVCTLTDMSRNGIYVNGDMVGQGQTVSIEANFTIHFTKPGKPSKDGPRVYKFEIYNNDCWSPENIKLRDETESQISLPTKEILEPPPASLNIKNQSSVSDSESVSDADVVLVS